MLDTKSLRWIPRLGPYDGPKYLALTETLDRAINSGELKPGDRLPSHRELGEAFGVTIATITKAIAEASRRGLVTARKGSGTFVAAPNEARPTTTAVELGLNTLPSALVADLVADALKLTAARSSGENLLSYTPYQIEGTELGAARAWLGARDVIFPSGHAVFPCAGVQQGLIAAIAALTQPGTPVLCEATTYTGILRAAALRGAPVIGVELDGEGAIPEALDRALAESCAAVFVCTPTVQNPTGRTMSEERRRKIAQVLRKRNAHLIEDAVNMPLAGGNLPPLCSYAPERAILLSGFSKCAVPGLRFALASTPPSLQTAFHDQLVATSWIAPKLHAAIAGEMIDSGAMDECIIRHRSEATARQAIAYDALGRETAAFLPSYHLWIDLPVHWDEHALVAAAAANDIHLTASQHFTCPDVAVPRALRICLGSEDDREVLSGALVRLGAILRGAQPLVHPVI